VPLAGAWARFSVAGDLSPIHPPATGDMLIAEQAFYAAASAGFAATPWRAAELDPKVPSTSQSRPLMWVVLGHRRCCANAVGWVRRIVLGMAVVEAIICYPPRQRAARWLSSMTASLGKASAEQGRRLPGVHRSTLGDLRKGRPWHPRGAVGRSPGLARDVVRRPPRRRPSFEQKTSRTLVTSTSHAAA
jgi:hypothetical protein